eukprot:TRINITY_DN1441_c0_g1_i16.p1 TRINITY_DN1441_c0_g1~~TRINITY_DN1441_c0_g1_i16.p1  ORF type:complete len:350 (-),score=39.08 TRINITY_DN1441_c0_g1_i16:617-1666(-)
MLDADIMSITALQGEPRAAWFDLQHMPVSAESALTGDGWRAAQISDRHGLADAIQRVSERVGELRASGCRRVVLGGFGQGAALALAAAMTIPHRISGVLLFSGWLPARIDQCPRALPIFWSHGRRDDEVEPGAAQAGAAILKSLGATLRFEWHEELAHSTCLAEMRSANEWLCELFNQQESSPGASDDPIRCQPDRTNADHLEDYGFMQRCIDKRTRGNAFVKQGHHQAAKELYEQALLDVDFLLTGSCVHLGSNEVVEVLHMKAAALSNKALCHLKLDDPRGCIAAAEQVAFGPRSLLPRVASSISGSFKEIPKHLQVVRIQCPLHLIPGPGQSKVENYSGTCCSARF